MPSSLSSQITQIWIPKIPTIIKLKKSVICQKILNRNPQYKNIKYTHHKKIKSNRILAQFLEFNCSGQEAVDIKIFYRIMRMSPLGLKNRLNLPKTTTTKTFTSKIQTKGRTLLICSKSKSINWEISTNFLMSLNHKRWKIPSKSFQKHFPKPQLSQIRS